MLVHGEGGDYDARRALIAEARIEAPALIVIGEVVRLAAEAPRDAAADLALAAAE